MTAALPLYRRVPRLVTLYRRLALRWPSAPRTLHAYRCLAGAVRGMVRGSK